MKINNFYAFLNKNDLIVPLTVRTIPYPLCTFVAFFQGSPLFAPQWTP